jgi:hypothetical protein
VGRFQKDKLIQIRGAAVHILSPDKLAELVAQTAISLRYFHILAMESGLDGVATYPA